MLIASLGCTCIPMYIHVYTCTCVCVCVYLLHVCNVLTTCNCLTMNRYPLLTTGETLSALWNWLKAESQSERSENETKSLSFCLCFFFFPYHSSTSITLPITLSPSPLLYHPPYYSITLSISLPHCYHPPHPRYPFSPITLSPYFLPSPTSITLLPSPTWPLLCIY